MSDGRLAVSAAGATMLTALALTPLARTAQWLLGALLVVLTVMVVGIVLRQVADRWGLPVIGQAVALFAILDLLFARHTMLLPFSSVSGLIDLGRAGLQVSRDQAAPVDPVAGIVFLLVGGVGVISLLVDVLAATLRQTALAGLPLLALYCVPAALLPNGLPWYLFALAAAGFLTLLTADSDERTLSWGRVLGGEGAGGGLAAAWLPRGGRRAAAGAVLAALLLPAVVPGVGGQLAGAGIGGGEGGSGAITRINPILTLRSNLNTSQDTTLLTYTTSVSDPEPLRIVTADAFNGKVWAPSTPAIPRSDKVQGALPAPPGLGPGIATTQAQTRISIGPLRQTYLPLPYPATKVAITGNWLYDPATLNVIGDHITTAGVTYTVNHLQVQPTAAQLAAATSGVAGEVAATYTSLPDRLPTVIRTTAQRVGGTGTPYQQAVNLQKYFRTEFRYDTHAPQVPDGTDSGSQAIAQFLADKRGYCVHFASAMATMARTLGIPARVAIGFLPGDRSPTGEMTVTSHDAHAWPELYFSGIGWVRFEPTPRGPGTTPPAWTQPTSSGRPQDSDSSSTSATPSAAAATASSRAVNPNADRDRQSAGTHARQLPWRLVGVIVLMLALLSLPRVAASLSRRRRWARARGADASRILAEAAWEDLRLGFGDLGLPWLHSRTPRALQDWLLAEYDLDGEPAAALRRLVTDVEVARYAPPGAGDGRTGEDRRDDVRLVLAAVGSTGGRMARVRAAGFPGSGIVALRELLEATSARSRALVERLAWRRRAEPTDDSEFTADRSDSAGSAELSAQEISGDRTGSRR